jgi:Kef-type K+ transport system membrane component KefB
VLFVLPVIVEPPIAMRGQALSAPSLIDPTLLLKTRPPMASPDWGLVRLPLQILVVLLAAGVGARALRLLGQPAVVGEMTAGIVLGPSLLGALLPGVSARLFPADGLRPLLALGYVGLVTYMFVVGLDVDHRLLRKRVGSVLGISLASIVVPFALGTMLAVPLYGRFATADVPFASFALFLGTAMSITAFPVLTRILDERGWRGTAVGSLATASAALSDVTVWCMLAAIVLVTRAHASVWQLLATVANTVIYLLVMQGCVRPVLRRLGTASVDSGRGEWLMIVCIPLLVLGSAVVAERIGLHAVFGAFLAGVVTPGQLPMVRRISQFLERVARVGLVPLFFASTGLRADVSLLGQSGSWALCGVVVLLATVGKLSGTVVAAHIAGRGWREAASLGVLMNTRGLMELVVLNIGLEAGVITRPIFTMFVVMALVTTLATMPLLDWIQPRAPGRVRTAMPVRDARGSI